MTKRNAMPGSGGRLRRNCVTASRPPADAPIPTTKKSARAAEDCAEVSPREARVIVRRGECFFVFHALFVPRILRNEIRRQRPASIGLAAENTTASSEDERSPEELRRKSFQTEQRPSLTTCRARDREGRVLRRASIVQKQIERAIRFRNSKRTTI